MEYKATLEKIDPHVQYLMTLYLSLELTPAEIRKAKRAGVVGRLIPSKWMSIITYIGL